MPFGGGIFGVNVTSTWKAVQGKPFVTVSPIGFSTAGVAAANNGADYGPDTSGTTTGGLQEAINALSSGGTIYVLKGTVTISSTVNWTTSNISLLGEQGAAITIPNSVTAFHFIDFGSGGVSNILIDGITFNGNTANVTPSTTLEDGIMIYNNPTSPATNTNIQYSNCRFINSSETVIKTTACTDLRYLNCAVVCCRHPCRAKPYR